MDALSSTLARPRAAWIVVALTLVVVAISAVFATRVRQEDDLLAFLPEGSAEIDRFEEINHQFGGLDVALVGLTPADPFAPAFLEHLAAATARIGEVSGVDRVLSLTNVQDFVEDPVAGGIAITDLVDHVPTSEADSAALRDKVMSRDHVVGALISREGDAVLIYCFLAYGTEPRLVAEGIRAAVLEEFPGEPVVWGGAPFVSTWIYDTTQTDMARLTPWAVVAIVVIILLSFRDWVGSALALFATGVGIVVARGAMGALGVADNLVLSSMPIILFAVGSAYSIHMLSRYYAHLSRMAPDAALRETMVHTAPTVIAAGLTTVAGLMSFLAMDIRPMRVFGLFSGLGIAAALLVSVTFVPAVIRLAHPTPRMAPGGPTNTPTARLVSWMLGHRQVGVAVLGAVTLIAAALATRVDNRMDMAAFFARGTPPDVAERFLGERFGGSQFLQVVVTGDLSDPLVLREVQRFADRARFVPHVTDTLAIPRYVGLINQAMTGTERLPDTSDQAGVLYGFLAGDPSITQLVTQERTTGLVQLRIGSTDPDVLDAVQREVEQIVATDVARGLRADPSGRAWLVDTVTWRIAALADRFDVAVPDRAALATGFEIAPSADGTRVKDALIAFLSSDECFVPLDPDQAAAVARAVAGLGPDPGDDNLGAALAPLFPDDPATADDLGFALAGPLPDAWRSSRAHTLTDRLIRDGLLADGPPAWRDAVAGALVDLQTDHLAVPDAAGTPIGWEISGMPVLYAAMSRSVANNQVLSLLLAFGLVIPILAVLFRSVTAGLLATAPTAVTLALIYAGMVVAGIRLDVGTAMIASLIIGAGVDYAVHLLAAWEAPEEGGLAAAAVPPDGGLAVAARHAVDEAGPAIWTNALMVAIGFFVLTLGKAKPLQNVGGLVSCAMLLAALAAFVVIPLLARRHRYGR